VLGEYGILLSWAPLIDKNCKPVQREERCLNFTNPSKDKERDVTVQDEGLVPIIIRKENSCPEIIAEILW
jgi:hypothetical protein